MSILKNLLAFSGRVEDYEWSRVAKMPAEPTPTAPAETGFYCRDADGELIEAGEFFKNYADSLLADPKWHAENERKAAEKAAKNQARLARIEQRRQTVTLKA